MALDSQGCIYYIWDRDNPSVKYIGQHKHTSIERALEHFSGLYHFNKDGQYFTSKGGSVREGVGFVDWLHNVTLSNVVIEIFEAPYYGIPVDVWHSFWSQWSTSKQHKNTPIKTTFDENGVQINIEQDLPQVSFRNAAEILHIYYALKNGNTLLQAQMGGQNEGLFHKTKTIVLNRDMTPQQMVNLIDARPASIESFQKAFDKSFTKNVLRNKEYINIIKTINWTNTTTDIFFELKQKTSEFLLTGTGQTILERIIRSVQDDTGSHSKYMRLSYPKGHDKVFDIRTKDDKNFKSFVNAIANHLKRNAKTFARILMLPKKEQNKELNKFFTELKGYVSVGTLLDISNIVTFNGLPPCHIGSGIDKSAEAANSLRRMSYYYFKNFADEYFREYNGKETFKGTFLGENNQKYKRIEIRHCESYIWEKYKEQKINNKYTKSYNKWHEFALPMLTLYTKNNGSLYEGDMEFIEGARDRDGVVEVAFLGAFKGIVEDEQGYIYLPAYTFSQDTFLFMKQHINSITTKELLYY